MLLLQPVDVARDDGAAGLDPAMIAINRGVAGGGYRRRGPLRGVMHSFTGDAAKNAP